MGAGREHILWVNDRTRVCVYNVYKLLMMENVKYTQK